MGVSLHQLCIDECQLKLLFSVHSLRLLVYVAFKAFTMEAGNTTLGVLHNSKTFRKTSAKLVAIHYCTKNQSLDFQCA